jgi:hypothetical protein
MAHAALALALGGMVHCDNLDNVDVSAGGKAVIKAGTLVETVLSDLDLQAFESIDFSSQLENQGVTKDDVDSVKMTQFVVRIEGPAGANFDFLDSVKFYAEAQGQPKILIAELVDVPTGAMKIELDVDPDVELKPYVVAPRMTISGEVSGKRPKEDTTVAAEVVLDVDVTIPGC